MNTKAKWMRLICCLLALFFVLTACQKTPEDIRAWQHDKRCPQKMKLFVEDEKSSLEVQTEALMVEIDRSEGPKIPEIFANIPIERMDRIVAAAIPRLSEMMDSDNFHKMTLVKDGSYYLRQFPLNEENTDALNDLIVRWFAGQNGDNFFVPLDKVGRVEQRRLFERLGTASLPVFQNAFVKLFAELDKTGPNPVASRAIQQDMNSALDDLNSLKLEGANDFIADIFVEQINKHYPDLALVYAVPFKSNPSDKLVPVAERITQDPNYSNPYLNEMKNAILFNYYPNVRPQEGIEVYKKIIKGDRTGMARWNAAEQLTKALGKNSVETFLNLLPDDITVLDMPADHPQAKEYTPGSFFWYQSEIYCRSVTANTNNQVPLDVFRKYASAGRTVERLVSIICLSYIGTAQDQELLNSLGTDNTSMANWNLATAQTIGDFAKIAAAAFPSRHEEERKRAEAIKKAAE